jgi:hypothetical protein
LASKEIVTQSTNDSAEGKTRVGIEIAIFGGQSGLFNVVGELRKGDWGSTLVGKYFVDKGTVTIE